MPFINMSYSLSGFKGMQEEMRRQWDDGYESYSLSGFKGMQEV